VETTGAFLKALKFRHDDNTNKVRGLKNGILIRNRDTGQPMHVLPNQYLLYRGETDCYFPENMETEKKTQSILGSILMIQGPSPWPRLSEPWYINIMPMVDEEKNKTSLRSSFFLWMFFAIGGHGLFMGLLIFAILATVLLLPYLLCFMVDPQ